MDGSAKRAAQTRAEAPWDPFDDLPRLPAVISAIPPAASCTLADDLLSEIDGLLSQQDFLVGYWQAPGE